MRDPDQPLEIGRLKRRADFLRAAKGRRAYADAISVHANLAPASPLPAPTVRIGFTLTRKVGSAVVRNRIRRRLKDAVRLAPGLPVLAGHDYVVLGREAALHMPFAALCEQLSRTICGTHAPAKRRRTRAGTGHSLDAGTSQTSSKGIEPQP